MKETTKIKYFIVSILFIPSVIFAFSLGVNTDTTFETTINYILEIIRLLIPILSGVAFLVFFWGLSKFILNSNKPEEIKNGKNYMIWGVFTLFILLTFMTIIGFVSNELQIGAKNPIIPTLKTTTTP
ncbi:MAG: hypothetical protein NTX96_01045 [Candidatus Zambryskibacteria bacterium]|nr:hypothetical protein [Candidatus Zambryskibacteria bacterium]